MDKLKDINNLKSNSLTVGQILKVADTTTEQPSETTNTYTVVNGDSLWKIAQKYKTSVNEIKQLNNLSTDNLSVGQVLKIPKTQNATPSQNQTTYTVVNGDSLWKIANRFGTTVDKIKSANNLKSDSLSIGQTLIIPTATQYTSYTVVSGDTLYFIAQRFKTTVDKIKTLNNLSSNNLTIGQKLLIPN